MIMIIGDVHGQFQVINQQISFAETHTGKIIDAVIVLGDMGIYERPLKKFFSTDGKRFSRPVFFIEGNHEEFARFNDLVASYREFMTYLPRGHITTICDIRFLSLGGACYMDALNSPSGSEIKDHDIARCLAHQKGAVDMVITHDCPAGIGVPNSPGLEFYGEPGFARGHELITHYRPQKWFFGHHHRWFVGQIDTTEFLGLPESWKGFGLLDEQRQFTSFDNPVPLGEGWFRGLLKKLFG